MVERKERGDVAGSAEQGSDAEKKGREKRGSGKREYGVMKNLDVRYSFGKKILLVADGRAEDESAGTGPIIFFFFFCILTFQSECTCKECAQRI